MTQPSHDAPASNDPEDLRAQVEHSREELGQTVAALAAKADVKARAQEKATAVKEQVDAKTGEIREGATRTVRKVRDRLPEPVRGKASRAGQAARGNRGALLVAGTGLAAVVWLACRRRRG
ncbi:DUF3618 domain-containing protein [Streptomyces sp. PTM05]|uniref:DUF3618 domain-containing protein n=1 Tax=Streptantibioticus parmotrematis TaxID=2873249 RepID=A0ABS7QQ82_9ACTN|nr:DUF3618 domain-containing protein [Streptantibioticus parmotrematis]MBY8885351.1 DUF3618 domain-containing protein [Streptantibioticus parmotrematis]